MFQRVPAKGARLRQFDSISFECDDLVATTSHVKGRGSATACSQGKTFVEPTNDMKVSTWDNYHHPQL